MKQKKQLAVMLSMLAVSVGMYAAVSLAEASAPVQETAAAAETVQAMQIPAEEVTGLAWNNGTEEIQAVLKDGTWSFAQRPDFPVLKNRVEAIIDEIASLKADRTLPADGNLTDYGLGDAARKLDLTLQNGEKLALQVGSRAKVEDGCYIMEEGGKEIWLAKTRLPEMLAADILDFVHYESVPSMIGPTEMTVTFPGEAEFVMNRLENAEQYCYTDYYTWFTPQDGGWKPLDRAASENLIAALVHISWKSCVDYQAEDLSRYGLEDGSAICARTGDGTNEIRLRLGKDAGEDTIYASLEGSRMVYTLSKADADVIRNASYETLRPQDICHMDWSTVTHMKIEADGIDREIEIQAAAGNDSTAGYVYLENGQELTGESVRAIQDMINKMVPVRQTDRIPEDLPEQPRLKITFRRNTEYFPELELAFYSYSSQYDLVRFEDEMRQLISFHAADAVIRLCERLEYVQKE